MNTHMNMKLDNLIDKVLKDSGYLAELKADKKTENESRIENLKEFIGVARDFEKSEETPNLETFLSQLSLVSDIDNADIEDDRVTLMTLHSAKGLEFPIVFMIGMEEGLFPHSRTLMNPDEIEEERRTCYVGITRAQRKLYLTNARQRTIYGKTQAFPPSRFLKEIPDEYVERLVPRANAYGFANANHYGAQQRSGFMSFRPSASQMGTGTHFAGKPQSALEAMEALRERQSSARPAAAGVTPPRYEHQVESRRQGAPRQVGRRYRRLRQGQRRRSRAQDRLPGTGRQGPHAKIRADHQGMIRMSGHDDIGQDKEG